MSSKPPDYTFLDEETNKKMLELFKGEQTGWLQVGEKKWFFPYKYIEEREGYYNFKARPSDTWVLSFPRSGTTWVQELVWLLGNNMDFTTAKKILLDERFPYLENSLHINSEVKEYLKNRNKGILNGETFCEGMGKPGFETLETASSPRFIKSHFPISLLPGILDSGCKVIYLARNPKDVIVSWYMLHKSIALGFTGDFKAFWNCFKNNIAMAGPYWEHVKEAWAKKDHPNLLFLFYEDMQTDLIASIKKIANFLGKDINETKMPELLDHLSIKNFRKNPMVNWEKMYECGILLRNDAFVRKGKSGGWKEVFTEQLEKEADEWIAENLKGTDLTFPTQNIQSD